MYARSKLLQWRLNRYMVAYTIVLDMAQSLIWPTLPHQEKTPLTASPKYILIASLLAFLRTFASVYHCLPRMLYPERFTSAWPFCYLS